MTIPARRLDACSLAAPVDGVIKAPALASAHEARGIIEQARHEAARLLDEARARVDDEELQRQAELEQRMWRHAADYATAVGKEWDRSLAELETRTGEVVGRALRRLVEGAPSDERLRACVQQLVMQAGAPDGGMLLVAEADHATLLALAESLPWPMQRSGELEAGSVRLVSSQGRWECDIPGALERLLRALGVQTEAQEAHEESIDG